MKLRMMTSLIFLKDTASKTLLFLILSKFFFNKFPFFYFNSKGGKKTCIVKVSNEIEADKARKNLNMLMMEVNGKSFPIRISKYEKEYSNSMTNLFIKKISKKLTPRQFYELFLKYGDIKSCKLELDYQGNSRGYGYVTYFSPESTLLSLKELNKQKIEGEEIEIIDIIATSDNKNVVYIKHLPLEFKEKNIHDFLSSYGDISNIKMTIKEGRFTGVAIVFYNDYRSAIAAIKDITAKGTTFPGQLPIYITNLEKREDRSSKTNMKNLMMQKQKILNKNVYDPVNLIARLVESDCLLSPEEFEKELRLFIKVVMLSEFSPISIQVNPKNFAIFTLKNQSEAMSFMDNYSRLATPEFIITFFQREIVNPNIGMKPPQMNSMQGGIHEQKMQVNEFHPNEEIMQNPNDLNKFNKFNNVNLHPNMMKNNPNEIGGPIMGNTPQQFSNPQHQNMMMRDGGKILIPNYGNNVNSHPQMRQMEGFNFIKNPNTIVMPPQQQMIIRNPPPLNNIPFNNPHPQHQQPMGNNQMMFNNNRILHPQPQPQPIPPQQMMINRNINPNLMGPPMSQNGFPPQMNNPNFNKVMMHPNDMNKNGFPQQGMQFMQQPPQMNMIGKPNQHFNNNVLYEKEKQVFNSDLSMRNNSHLDSKFEFNFNEERLKEMNTEELANEIYDIVSSIYEKEASKITGMLSDLGDEEVRRLLENPLELKELINQAYQVRKIIFIIFFNKPATK